MELIVVLAILAVLAALQKYTRNGLILIRRNSIMGLKIQHKSADLMLNHVEISAGMWYNIVESSFHNETEDCYEMPSEIKRACSAAWRSVHE